MGLVDAIIQVFVVSCNTLSSLASSSSGLGHHGASRGLHSGTKADSGEGDGEMGKVGGWMVLTGVSRYHTGRAGRAMLTLGFRGLCPLTGV